MKTAQEQCSRNLEEVIRTIDSAVRDHTDDTTPSNRRNIIVGVILEIVSDALDNTFFGNGSSMTNFLSLAGVRKGGNHEVQTAADELSDAIDKSYNLDKDHVEKSACHAGNSTGEAFVGTEFEQCSFNLQRVIRIVDGAVKNYLRDAEDTTRAEIMAGVVIKIVGDALDNTFVRKPGKSTEFFSTSGLRNGNSLRTYTATHYLSVAIRSSYYLGRDHRAKE